MFERLTKEEKKLFERMLNIAKKREVCLKILKDKKRGRFFIVAKDWPGLSDAISGALHEKGFNLSLYLGFTIEKKYAGIIAEVELSTKELIEKFDKEKDFFKKYLPDIAKFDPWMSGLLASTSSKLRVFREVLRILRKEIRSRKKTREIVEETEKFFSSRSWAYIGERKPEDLAQQILMQIELQRLVKEKGGIHVHIKNFRTISEELTGILIAGSSRELFLDQVLDVLREIIPDFRRKFEKVFTTPDGITVIRLEITDSEDRWISEERHFFIEKYLVEHLKLRTRKIMEEKVRVSPEMIGRILIPSLIKEARESGIPQVYILLTGITGEYYHFKFLCVARKKEGKTYTEEFISKFSFIPQIKVLSYKAPSFSYDHEIVIINFSAKIEFFSSPEEVYRLLSPQILDVLGNFRDFDVGLRRVEEIQFRNIEQKLAGSGIEPHLLKRLYYSLDEFFRVQTDPDDIVKGFSMLWELNVKISAQEGFMCEREKGKKNTIICFGGKNAEKVFSKLIEEARGLEMSALRFDDFGVVNYLVFLSYNKRPLEDKEMEDIIKKICENFS